VPSEAPAVSNATPVVVTMIRVRRLRMELEERTIGEGNP
jgi:hypothetical protein